MARLPSSCPQLVSIAHGAPAHGRSGLRVTVLASHVCLRRCELGGRGCTRRHSRYVGLAPAGLARLYAKNLLRVYDGISYHTRLDMWPDAH